MVTIFLSNRECPWRCLMCDLWRHTLEAPVPAGAIPVQVEVALSALEAQGPATVLKLYNAGSFFDAQAIPPSDWAAIAERAARFERVVVECHPTLVGRRCLAFRDALVAAAAAQGRRAPVLEVAMGLETVEEGVLAKLNKGMALDDFRRAARFLVAEGMALRAFVLVKPPFQDETEAAIWAERSAAWAFAEGASVVSLIPVRLGNGALEALAAQGVFAPPSLDLVEAVQEAVLGMGRGRVLVDLWDLEAFASCPHCREARRERLASMNLEQRGRPRVVCGACGNCGPRSAECGLGMERGVGG